VLPDPEYGQNKLINHHFRQAILVIFMLCCINYSYAEVKVMGVTAYYTGDINEEKNRRFFSIVQGKAIRSLVITSSGGEVEAGIELGYWVHDQQVDIEIPVYCMSSCANYVFTAGNNKFIAAGAIVAWHGNYNHLLQTGLWKDDIAYRMEQTGEDEDTAMMVALTVVDRLVRLEQFFFEHIGVNEYICWIGKMPPHNVPNYYFLSSEDMARFGVGNVHTPDDYGTSNGFSVEEDIRYVSLSNE
jgi:hypothetical protein